MLDNPHLDTHDRQGGAFADNAISPAWLQDGLDLFISEFPYQGAVRKGVVTIKSDGTAALPADFVLDVRNGLLLHKPPRRCRRRGLQELINASLAVAGPSEPRMYCWSADQLLVTPAPKAAMTATLWYYSLPPVLGPATIPSFPSDWVLVEFVRLRGEEWKRAVPPMTARKYGMEECARLRANGLMGEPESDRIPFDEDTWKPTGLQNDTDWMGGTTVPQ